MGLNDVRKYQNASIDIVGGNIIHNRYVINYSDLLPYSEV